MNNPRYSKAAARLALAALLSGCALLAPGGSPQASTLKERPATAAKGSQPAALVAAKTAKTAKTAEPGIAKADAKVASNEPQYASATLGLAAGAGDASTCQRPRKRLWVEGEGWIVRRVAVCP